MEKISCITVCRNNLDGLRMTLESAIKLNPPLFEQIVIDGDSIDGTKVELPFFKERFEKKSIRFRFVSEPDNGIFDAMNKGIDMAEGTWLNFMNAGDMYATEHVIEDIFSAPVPEDVGLVYGDDIHRWRDGYTTYTKRSQKLDHPEKNMPNHQASFFRRSEMSKHKYSLKYKLVADRAWIIEFLQSGGKHLYRPGYVSIYDKGGQTSQCVYATFCANMEMRKDYGLGDPVPVIWVKKAILRFLDCWDKHMPWKLTRKFFP